MILQHSSLSSALIKNAYIESAGETAWGGRAGVVHRQLLPQSAATIPLACLLDHHLHYHPRGVLSVRRSHVALLEAERQIAIPNVSALCPLHLIATMGSLRSSLASLTLTTESSQESTGILLTARLAHLPAAVSLLARWWWAGACVPVVAGRSARGWGCCGRLTSAERRRRRHDFHRMVSLTASRFRALLSC